MEKPINHLPLFILKVDPKRVLVHHATNRVEGLEESPRTVGLTCSYWLLGYRGLALLGFQLVGRHIKFHEKWLIIT